MKPTEEDLSRDLAADAEYVRGYVNCVEGGRMHAGDAMHRLQRVSRIAEAAIRRALAAEGEVQRLKDKKCIHDLAKEWAESALTPHFPDGEEGDVK